MSIVVSSRMSLLVVWAWLPSLNINKPLYSKQGCGSHAILGIVVLKKKKNKKKPHMLILMGFLRGSLPDNRLLSLSSAIMSYLMNP